MRGKRERERKADSLLPCPASLWVHSKCMHQFTKRHTLPQLWLLFPSLTLHTKLNGV